MEFLILFPLAIVLMIFTRWRDKQLMRLDWGSVAKFLAFMTFLTVFRISANSFLSDMAGLSPATLPIELIYLPVWHFFLVWWEDAIFALPIYWLLKKCKKWIAIPLIIALSLYFGYGHLYQGWFAVGLLSIYPYFISYRYGKRVGFGTVMVCHVLYDFITFYTAILMPSLV